MKKIQENIKEKKTKVTYSRHVNTNDKSNQTDRTYMLKIHKYIHMYVSNCVCVQDYIGVYVYVHL